MSAAPRVGDDWYEEVTALVHRGLLAEAEGRLAQVLATPRTPGDRGWAELLAGNIAYERGEWLVAQAHYRESLTLLAEAGQDGSAVVQNVELVSERLARSANLGQQLVGLQLAVILAVAVGALGVAILARRTN